MANKVLKAGDILSGQEGSAYANINGEIVDLFFIKNIEATFDKTKSEVKTLGKRGTQYKANGWNGTGNMTVYYVSSVFRSLASDYINNGRDVYFDITITNEDPSSSTGKQTITLYDCNLDSTLLAKLDVDSEYLDEDLDFTFSGVKILDEFNEIE